MFPSDASADLTATLLTARPHEEIRPRPEGVTVRVIEGPNKGEVHRVRSDQIVIGRNALCDVVLDTASVSQRHASLSLYVDHVVVRDLGSRNGIWIDRARVKEAHLYAGAEFFVGDDKLRLEAIKVTDAAVYKGHRFGGLIGVSEKMRALFSVVERLAKTPLVVLIQGETGTGKGEVARAMHQASGRGGNFVTVDCGTLPRELADALLLGHARGAFTGAVGSRMSPFEEAEGGTVFLDEIGELPLELQPKLLRVVDRKEVQRIGETESRSVDVRIVAATNRDLDHEVAEGRFRLDLYHRLRSALVRVAPLRDRPEDIPALAQEFLKAGLDASGRTLTLVPETLDVLRYKRWPGNVRELKGAIERAVYLADGPEILPNDLADIGEPAAREGAEHLFSIPLKRATEQFQRLYIEQLLAATGGDVAIAAEKSEYTVRGINALLKRLGIDRDEVS